MTRLSVALIALMTFTLASYGQNEQVKWEESLEAALAEAKETGKRVLADFTSKKN